MINLLIINTFFTESLDFLLKPYQEEYSNTQIVLEVIAVSFGIASVFFAKQRNILVFPTGIVSTTLFIYLLLCWELYGDMLINIYYTIMSLYGWVLWHNNTEPDHTHVTIEQMNRKEYKFAIVLFLFSATLVLLTYFLAPIWTNLFNLKPSEFLVKLMAFFNRNNIDAFIAKMTWIQYVDIFTTGIFLVGMYSMAKRKIENWLFWIAGNTVSIPMYIVKGYGITSLQYCIFLILAILGYLAWRKQTKSIPTIKATL